MLEVFGEIDSIFLAHSTDENIRFMASSGGFIKSFLVYLLESHEVDFAIITRTGGPESPLIPETIITNSKTDILSTRTNSVYMMNNPFRVFWKIKADKKYAFVGLPCQIKPARKHANIEIIICLICNYAPINKFTRDTLKLLDVNEDEVYQIAYRGNGWPGGFTAYLKNGQQRFIPLLKYFSHDERLAPIKCRNCHEIGQDADIVVGDPWLLSLTQSEKKGLNLVICRKKKMRELIQQASAYVKSTPCSRADLIKSQGKHFERKMGNCGF